MRKIIRALAVVGLVLAGLVGLAPAASADCCDHWHSASWGRGYLSQVEADPGYLVIKTDDTLTDGYCVDARRKTSTGSWVHIGDSTSCGPIAYTQTSASYVTLGVRLYRANGSYLTLCTGGVSCDP